MPEIFSWIMLGLGVAAGAGAAFLILKNRGQKALHAKDTELAGLVAKDGTAAKTAGVNRAGKQTSGRVITEAKRLVRVAGSHG